MRNASIRKKVDAWETKYYSSETRAITDTVSSNVDAYTANALWYVHDIPVSNYYQWNVDDNLLVNGKNGDDGLPLVFHIVGKVVSGGILKCIVLNGTGTNKSNTVAISSTTVISRIGNAKAELDASTDPFAIMPTPAFNYNQIHMAQVEESFIERMHNKEVAWDMKDMYNQAMWDFRGQIEFANLMGVKRIALDPLSNNEEKYFAGGIVREMTKSLTWAASSATNKDFYNLTKNIFTGNNGSESRILFADSEYMSYLGGVPTVQKQLEGKDVVVKWGVKFHSIETNFGELLVKHAPGFGSIGLYESGVVLDMAFVEKHIFVPMTTRKIDYVTSGVKAADANVIKEVSCAVLKNLDTHALITKTS